MKQPANCTCTIPKPFDIKKIDLTCKSAYDLMESGLTKGIFQIDSYLGRLWGPRLAPRTEEEIADLISIVRPGCLETGMSERYIRYKKSGDTPEYLHADLEKLLSATYGQMIYQEQMMNICWSIAGLDEETADHIRKACGKKKEDEMNKEKKFFIKACIKKGYSKEFSELVWGDIAQSAKYSFNKAHAICYAIISYRTAFIKAHFPIEFFCTLLNCAKYEGYPQEEITEIITDCWRFGIEVVPPSIRDLGTDFVITKDEKIHFGTQNIKGIGQSKSARLKKFKEGDTFSKTVMNMMSCTGKDVFEYLIKCGVFDNVTKNRKMLLGKIKPLQELTKKELAFVKETVQAGNQIERSIEILVSQMGGRKTRIAKVQNILAEIVKAGKISTKPIDIAMYEKNLMGMVLSKTGKKYYGTRASTHKCGELTYEAAETQGTIFATIDNVRLANTRDGKTMAYVSISDDTGGYEGAIVWPNKYFDLQPYLYKGSTRLFDFKIPKDRAIITNIS